MAKEKPELFNEDLLPTPTKGDIVFWYDRNLVAPDRALPAMVMDVEGPGKIKLKILRMGDDMHKTGVHHVSHPVHNERNHAASVHNGSWDYRKPGVPTEDYEYHRAFLAERKKKQEAEQAAAAQALANGKQPATV